ncbi:MAG: diphthamide synthesis protein, partial [Candidatus Aenigmarchaeota archaeon]|nr:diphthamide synthesis protein [Candidatus Aenigmarchaeota archaeon]
KIYTLDIEKMKVEEVDTAALERRRYANIYNAKNARSFAVLVTTKKGQNQLLGKAEEIKSMIKERGRDAFILVMNEINDTTLLGVKADAFVNTACPRIVEDSFSKPIVNAEDVEKVLADS